MGPFHIPRNASNPIIWTQFYCRQQQFVTLNLCNFLSFFHYPHFKGTLDGPCKYCDPKHGSTSSIECAAARPLIGEYTVIGQNQCSKIVTKFLFSPLVSFIIIWLCETNPSNPKMWLLWILKCVPCIQVMVSHILLCVHGETYVKCLTYKILQHLLLSNKYR